MRGIEVRLEIHSLYVDVLLVGVGETPSCDSLFSCYSSYGLFSGDEYGRLWIVIGNVIFSLQGGWLFSMKQDEFSWWLLFLVSIFLFFFSPFTFSSGSLPYMLEA